MTSEVYDTSTLLNSASGSFSASLTGLSEDTRYYYQAVMTLADGSDVEGAVLSFTTASSSATIKRAYLDCYEIPSVSVTSYTSETETYGDTKYHAYGTPDSMQRVVTHTFAYNGTKRNYSMLYDGNKRAALWVAFAMNTGSYPWLVDRTDDWEYDPAINSSWQPELYSGYAESSTYDRGHQVAAHDRETTTNQVKQTTYFSNMTPQLGGFNGGVWGTLEGDIQKIGNATSGRDTLYVVTGPIFGSGYGTTTDKKGKACAVPTHYYKCIMRVSFSALSVAQSATGAAYLLKHESGATRQEVTINHIESLTGFTFFANVPQSIRDVAKNETHPTSDFPQKSF